VIYLSGTLSATGADGSIRLLALGSRFDDGDVLGTPAGQLRTHPLRRRLRDRVAPDTRLEIAEVSYREEAPAEDGFAVRLLKGGMRAVTGLISTRSRDRVRYDTPVATIGIRGTHFGLLFCQSDCAGLEGLKGQPLRDGLHVDLVQGAIELANRAGTLQMAEGQFAYVADADTAPRLAGEDEGIPCRLPASVLFDVTPEVWSDGVTTVTADCPALTAAAAMPGLTCGRSDQLPAGPGGEAVAVEAGEAVLRVARDQLLEGVQRGRVAVRHPRVGRAVGLQRLLRGRRRREQRLVGAQRQRDLPFRTSSPTGRTGSGPSAPSTASDTHTVVPSCLLMLSRRAAVLTGSPSAR
jgi:hypothetical protein